MNDCDPKSSTNWSIGSTGYFVAYFSIYFALSVYAAITVSNRSKKSQKAKDITSNAKNNSPRAVRNIAQIETQHDGQATKNSPQNNKNEVALSQRVKYTCTMILNIPYFHNKCLTYYINIP